MRGGGVRKEHYEEVGQGWRRNKDNVRVIIGTGLGGELNSTEVTRLNNSAL